MIDSSGDLRLFSNAIRFRNAANGATTLYVDHDGETNLYHPPRPKGRNYDWQTVTTLAAKNGRSGLFNSVQKDLVKPETNNFGFIPSVGGTAKISRKEITKSRLLVYEIDDEELTSQWGVWEDAGLPEPTVVMDSGNKSYHVWHALKEYADIEVIENLRKRISQTIWNYCGFNTDTSLHSCHQPTRLAGAIHPKGGRRSTVVYGTGNTYSIEEILKTISFSLPFLGLIECSENSSFMISHPE